jgi:hypothetical protein
VHLVCAWKHRFSSQCLSVVHDKVFGARTPSYKTIQELDKMVRNFYLPPSLQVPGFGGTNVGNELVHPTVELTMQRHIAFAIREISKWSNPATTPVLFCLAGIFYMHRGFFAQALEDHPKDPLSSKYSPSVLAAYSSACSFVGVVSSLFAQHPALTERMWFLFSHGEIPSLPKCVFYCNSRGQFSILLRGEHISFTLG